MSGRSIDSRTGLENVISAVKERITVRPACPDDAEAICTLNREDLGYDYPPEETRRKLEHLLNDHAHRILVAELDGTVSGYLHLSDYDVLYAPPMKNILGIAVSGRCRKMGIGKALLAAAEQWAKETGACGIRLVSGSERTGAHEFYRRCGYQGQKQQINLKKYL